MELETNSQGLVAKMVDTITSSRYYSTFKKSAYPLISSLHVPVKLRYVGGNLNLITKHFGNRVKASLSVTTSSKSVKRLMGKLASDKPTFDINLIFYSRQGILTNN